MSESTSPVLALRYNILSAFEKANESIEARLQAAIEQGRISPEIELDERPGIPVATKISRDAWIELPKSGCRSPTESKATAASAVIAGVESNR
jgi:hypothetical protein